MHIPDGFLATPVWVALDASAIPAIGILARRARVEFDELRIPALGVMGAFVFAAQMINFPVAPGASGHLVGAALLAFTLGPAAASLVMTAILAIQALVFQDGGVLALGANVWNMALAGVLAAHLGYRLLRGSRAGVFLGAAFSVLVGAFLALGQLLVSGVPMRPELLVVTASLFLVNALAEGVITVAALGAIRRIHPGWVLESGQGVRPAIWLFGGAALILAVLGVLIASPLPDALERFLEDSGVAARAQTLLHTPFGDYETAFLPGDWLRKASAGLLGLGLILVLLFATGRWLATRRRS
jgi:cobalt/nickel transport system permease protein